MISQQTLTTLEFPKVLERLAKHTNFSASRDLALSLKPSTSPVEVRERLQRTTEARRLFDSSPDVSIGGARDIRPAAAHARRGGILDAPVLLEVHQTLAAARRLRVTLLKLDATQFELLQDLAFNLPNLPQIEDAITRTIGEDGRVLDSASPLLGRLRSDIRVAFGRLQDKLQSMITSSAYADALQEPIITVRNGRYVVPVKAGAKRSVRGLVHDQSGSGATLYIEPIAVVELNNKWRELQLAEEQEVLRILSELSEQVGAQSSPIERGVDALADFDLALALAKYAAALRCIEPEIAANAVVSDAPNPSPQFPAPLLLTSARHPLLDQQKVVPSTIHLGDQARLLLITGPNTGGKTVALKTAGLLALMAQAGMHIPAAEPSRLPIFGQVFADIGDEQSIEQSLSTFSSHMTNIIRILGELEAERARWQADWQQDPDSAAPPPALVLLDELGAGTDPVEGAALARAIIERLLEQEVLGIATTHYAELKAFAYATPGVVNGSVEFDVETLRPTYKLTIGLPGRSNALAIAARLGLDDQIVGRARSVMAREDAQVEDLLAGIYRERNEAAKELTRAEQLREDAEKYRERLSNELASFEQRRDAEWQAAQDELERDLREVRGQLKRLRDDFRSVSISRQWLDQAEQRIGEIRDQSPTVRKKSSLEKAVLDSIPAVPTGPQVPAPTPPRPLQAGDAVLVRSVGLKGEIIAIDEDEQTATVQVGGFRMEVGLRELQREKPGPNDQRRYVPPAISTPAMPDVSIELDIRGMRAGDVIDRIDRYINDAFLAGLPFVRIIHGKGTGALRQIVRESLQRSPLVASFEGGGNAGGEGVTVAKINEN
ncbi:MAG: endonuclease MutS2 [Roseiflexaceae bacterium]|nr:endonuclease MutS2 [Roseiflexaceae bacterium]